MAVHGFEEENITVLMDDGEHASPTQENMINAYKKVVAESGSGDAIFLHYSGHGTKLKDDESDEGDGYDEALVPLDYKEKGMIRDDDLYDILVKPLAEGTHMVVLVSALCRSTSPLMLVTLLYYILNYFSPAFDPSRWTAATAVLLWTFHTSSRRTEHSRK
jgi:metacaspase-1